MRKYLTITLITSVFLLIMAGVNYNRLEQNNFITLEDVEALSEDGSEGGCSWYLHHFDCELSVGADAKLYAIIKLLGLTLKGNGKADLTCMTQYFNQVQEDGEGPCEKGMQITCNEVCMSIINSAK